MNTVSTRFWTPFEVVQYMTKFPSQVKAETLETLIIEHNKFHDEHGSSPLGFEEDVCSEE